MPKKMPKKINNLTKTKQKKTIEIVNDDIVDEQVEKIKVKIKRQFFQTF